MFECLSADNYGKKPSSVPLDGLSRVGSSSTRLEYNSVHYANLSNNLHYESRSTIIANVWRKARKYRDGFGT